MQISTVGKNFCFSFVVSTHIYARKVTEPTHQHVVRVESWRRQHILIGCCCLTKHKLRQRNRISNTRKHFLCFKWNYPWTFANAIYSAGARGWASADISLCPAQLEGQRCKSNFLHHLQSAASQLSGTQTKSLVTISIIHAAGKQADLFHNKLPHREILNRAD